MRRIFVGLLVVFAIHSATAQRVISSRGKEFYCMVMKYYGTPDQWTGFQFNHYIRVFLSSPVAANATITLESPAFSKTVAMLPNVADTVDLPFEIEDTLPDAATRQAIHVVADTDISVYVMYHKLYSTDSYMALPVEALGNEHVAACYQTSFRPLDVSTAPEIGIAAVLDSTEVTITPSSTTWSGHTPRVPYTVLLNRGDTYLVYGDPNDRLCDLTGSAVNSNKPIAVFSGHERTAIPADSGQSRDCLVEQIPPNGTLGTSFITVPFVPRTPPMYDYFRVIAPIDSTVISLDGVVVATINAGMFYEFVSVKPTQIRTTNPVLVAQYALSATDSTGNYPKNGSFDIPWDPAMMIVPPTQQFLSEYTFANSIDVSFEDSYVNVVIPDGAVPSLLLDGAPVATPFQPIPGTGYSYAQVRDSQGSHHIEASQAFGIYVYGFGHADSYANTGGAAFRVLHGLLVATSDLDFGNVSLDSCKDSVIVFRNSGNDPITVWSIWLADSNAGDFTITGGKPPFTIAPGDTHAVLIKFCPSAAGVRGLATLRFTSNAVERPTITIHGRGLRIGVEADDLVLDFLRVTVGGGKDSVFTLRNIGVRTVQFDSLTITGRDAAMFTLVSPLGPFTLAPNVVQPVTVHFAPTSRGIKHAMIATAGTSGFYASVDLIGEGVVPMMAGEPDTVDYRWLRVGRTRDSLLTTRSVGFAPASVGGYALTGLDAGEFVLVTQPGVRTVAPGDTLEVTVRFQPTTPGVKFADLSWRDLNDGKLYAIVALRGTAAYPSVAIRPNVVDYKNVKVGKRRDSLLAIANIGHVEAVVRGYQLAGPDPADFQVTPATEPTTLLPGESAAANAAFVPTSTGPKHAVLLVLNDGTTPDTISDLYGNARQGQSFTTTKTDTILAHIGDTIHVPVRLQGPLDNADITAYRIVLGFDSTMLYPIGIHADSSWSALAFDPALNFTPGVAAVRGVSSGTLTGDGTLYVLDMQVLLGDALATPLQFSEARYSDVDGYTDVVTTALRHGLLQIVGFCGDTSGLIKVGVPLTLSSISPNPLSSDALVSFTVPALGPVRVALVDMIGRDAAVLADGEHTPGQYVAMLRAGSLSPGAYTLVLQAGRFRETRRVEIVR